MSSQMVKKAEPVASKAESSHSDQSTALEIPESSGSSDDKSVEYLEHGNDENLQHKLWVGNLDYRITEYQIIKILQRFGKIKYFYYPYSKSLSNPQASGYCFVEYDTRKDAEGAKRGLEGRMLLNRTVRVSWSTGRTQSLLKQTGDSDTASKPKKLDTSAKINAIEAKLLLMQHGQEAVIGVPNRPRPKPYDRDRPGGRGGRGGYRGGRGDGFRRRY
ncbi:probable RNA-binding protein 18 [Sycon ciliatum]|uniref:probable RNA-binding protein 18 n=1 Tax=Sycon ciliatum TaxID=27933 RepID=UPI0031F5FB78